jgi:DNA-binding MarR family transcriptional regulator
MIAADPLRAQFVGRLIATRAARHELLGLRAATFSDPAWDVLLVFAAHAYKGGGGLGWTQLLHTTGLPSTTFLRHMQRLRAAGIITNIPGTTGRRPCMILTAQGSAGLARIIDQLMGLNP